MKLFMNILENALTLSDCGITSLNIRDRALYSRVIYTLGRAREADDGDIYVEDDDGEIRPFDKLSMFVGSVTGFDFDSRAIQNKIIRHIDDALNSNPREKYKAEELYRRFARQFAAAADLYEYDLVMNASFDTKKIVRALDIRLAAERECASLFDTALKTVETAAKLDLCRLLVFDNLKSYLTARQYCAIAKTAAYRHLYVLSVQRSDSRCVSPGEKLILIDEDFYWSEHKAD